MKHIYFWRSAEPTLDQLRATALRQAEEALLEAEHHYERAEATRDMLRKTVARLKEARE